LEFFSRIPPPVNKREQLLSEGAADEIGRLRDPEKKETAKG